MDEQDLTLHAHLILDESPPRMVLHGSASVTYPGFKPVIHRSESTASTPSLLLLQLGLEEDAALPVTNNQSFTYSEQGHHVLNYQQVTVRCGKRIFSFRQTKHSSQTLTQV